jgi:hypothetical protein
MKRNPTTFIAQTVAMMLMTFGLLFATSGAANAATATALEVPQSTEVHVAKLLLDADPNIEGPFETRFECEVERLAYVLLFNNVSACRFDVPSRAFYFTYWD